MMEFQQNLPIDAKMEEYVLGALLQEPLWSKVDIVLNEDCFTDPDRQTVFRTLKSMYEKNTPVDIGTVWKEIAKDKKKGSTISAHYVASLSYAVTSSTNFVYHCEVIRELSIRRRLINEAHSLYLEAHDTSRDTFDLVGVFESKVKGLNVDFTRGIKTPKEAASKVLSNYEKAKNRELVKGAVKSYCGDLDELINFFMPGELVLFAARPAMGKTLAALAMIEGNSKRGVRGVIFELEMSDISLVSRIACNKAQVNSYYVKRGELSAEEYGRFMNAVGEIAEYPLGIDDTGGIDLFHLCSRIRKYVQQNPDTQYVVIDYLQLITLGTAVRVHNREQEISTISRTLKALAKELKLPIIALSQLSRESEKEKQYSLRHLRESGSLEQDADIVIFIHRHAYMQDAGEVVMDENGNDVTDRIDFIVLKYREGATGTKSGRINLAHQSIRPTNERVSMPVGGGSQFDNFEPVKNFYETENRDDPF